MIDKSLMVTIKMLCDSLDDSGLGVKALVPTSRKTTYEIFKSETVRLLSFLGCVDGEFSNREVNFINEYLDCDYTVKDLRRMVDNDKEIDSVETTVPVFMKIIINADNIRLQRGIPHGDATCTAMYQFFGEIGRNFIACDDKVVERETEALTNILETIRKYYEDKDEEWKEQNKDRADGDNKNGGNAGGMASAAKLDVSFESDAEVKAETEPEEEIGTLEELLEELNSLVGLEKVKKDVNSLINLAQIMKLREERGMKQVDITLHLVFSGNPGTGKTTIAKVIANTTKAVFNLASLAEKTHEDAEKYTHGLGQVKMSVITPRQDIVSMAYNATTDFITDDLKQQIDLVLFATESGIDESKSASIELHALLHLPERCRCLDIKHACYGGTGALHIARTHIQANNNSKVLVLMSDIAFYGVDTAGEATQGCGAIAMIISSTPKICTFNDDDIFLSDNRDDFYRPSFSQSPVYDGHFSIKCYLSMFQKAIKLYGNLYSENSHNFDYLITHMPFAKMLDKCCKLANIDFIKNENNVIKAYGSVVGNIYTASLYLGLLSLLENSKND